MKNDKCEIRNDDVNPKKSFIIYHLKFIIFKDV